MPVKQRVLDAVGFLPELPFTGCGFPFLAERAPGAGLCLGQGWEQPGGSEFQARIPPALQAGASGSFRVSVCDKLHSTHLKEAKILQQLINLLYFMMFAVPPWHPEDPGSLMRRV